MDHHFWLGFGLAAIGFYLLGCYQGRKFVPDPEYEESTDAPVSEDEQ